MSEVKIDKLQKQIIDILKEQKKDEERLSELKSVLGNINEGMNELLDYLKQNEYISGSYADVLAHKYFDNEKLEPSDELEYNMEQIMHPFPDEYGLNKVREYVQKFYDDYILIKKEEKEPSNEDPIVQPDIDLWEKNTVTVTCPFCHKGYYLAPRKIEERTEERLIGKILDNYEGYNKIIEKVEKGEYDEYEAFGDLANDIRIDKEKWEQKTEK